MKKNSGIGRYSVGTAGTEGTFSPKNTGPSTYRKPKGDVFSQAGNLKKTTTAHTRAAWPQDMANTISHGRKVGYRQSGVPVNKYVYHNKSIGKVSITSKGHLNYKPSFPKGQGNSFVSPQVGKYMRPVVPQAAAAVGTVGVVGGAIGGLTGDTRPQTTSKSDFKPTSFGKAFAHARSTAGSNSTFTYGNKEYSTVTGDQVRASGNKGLRQYLNKNKATKSKLKYVGKRTK